MFDTESKHLNANFWVSCMFQVLQLLFRADHNEEVIPYSDFYSVAVSEHASLEVSWSINDL